jgi:hypothetical protein
MRLKSRPTAIRFSQYAISALIVIFFPLAANAQIQITLKNTFIEKFKDRATIDATFTVDKAHKTPNPGSKDGDLHVAGRAPEIGLATVSEIMNAKDEDAAVKAIHAAEPTHKSVKLSGAWRIWCEHGGDDKQEQGKPIPNTPFTTTNPPHVFEIHPITSLNGNSISESLKPIVGFVTKDAEQSFTSYENKKCQLVPNATSKTTTIITSMGGFNYVEFRIKLLEAPLRVADGMMVFASVLKLKSAEDTSGEDEEDDAIIVQKRRMVFVKGSAPETAVKSLAKGAVLHVLGVPRISLTLVSFRTHNTKKFPGILTWNLPYEMLIVAVYND